MESGKCWIKLLKRRQSNLKITKNALLESISEENI